MTRGLGATALAVCILLTAWFTFHPLPLLAQEVCAEEPVLLPTSGSSISGQPSQSQNGETVVFWSTNPTSANLDGNIEIFAWRPSNPIPLTQVTTTTGNVLGGFNLSPSITLDGEYVSFLSDRDLNDSDLIDNNDGNFEIYLKELASTDRANVVTNSKGVSNRSPIIVKNPKSFFSFKLYLPLVSRSGDVVTSSALPTDDDGQYLRVFFISDAQSPTDLGSSANGTLTNGDGNSEIFLAERSIQASLPFTIVQLTNTKSTVVIDSISVSSDGHRIAYVKRDSANTTEILQVSDVRAGQLSPVISITSEKANIDQAELSGDGNHLVFRSNAVSLSEDSSHLLEASQFDRMFAINLSDLKNKILVTEGTSEGDENGQLVVNGQLIDLSISGDGIRAVVLVKPNDPNNSYKAIIFEPVFDSNATSNLLENQLHAIHAYQIPLTSAIDSLTMNSHGNNLVYLGASSQNTSTIVSLHCPIAELKVDVIPPNQKHPNVGEELIYTIRLSNVGRDPAQKVTLRLNEPKVVEFTKQDDNSVEITRTSVIWYFESLNANAPMTKTFVVRVKQESFGKMITGTVTIATTTFNRGRKSIDLPPIRITAVDLSASITVTNQAPRAGEWVTYTIQVTNTSFNDLNDLATGVRITITGLSSITPTRIITLQGKLENNSWKIGDLEAGGKATLQIVMQANARSGGGEPIKVALENLSADQEDANPDNNLPDPASAWIQVLGTDLAFTSYKVDKTDPKQNSTVKYDITLTNMGPHGDHSVFNRYKELFEDFVAEVVAPVPDDLKCLSASLNTQATIIPGTCTSSSVKWTIDKLPTKRSVVLTWNAKVVAKPSTPISVESPTLKALFKDNPEQNFPDPDPNNNTIEASALPIITVFNQAPTVTSSFPSKPLLNEAQEVTLQLQVTDDDMQPMPLAIRWGDGSPVFNLPVEHSQEIVTYEYKHTYADDDVNDRFTITINITDAIGQMAPPITLPVTVRNVSPTLTLKIVPAPALDPAVGISSTIPITVNASFADPGYSTPWSSETFSYTVNWGDNAINSGPVQQVTNGHSGVPTTGTFTLSHTYAITGTRSIAVKIIDDDGGSDRKVSKVYVKN